jgi:alpha-L-fucosidase
MAYPFQTETSISDWHYKTGQKYMDAPAVIKSLMENVCRNGTMLLNLTQHGRGDLDPEVTRIAKDVGAWLRTGGEAVYGSRPFEVYGESGIRYTRNKGDVYATLIDWDGGPVTLMCLRIGGATLGKVSRVELLGSDTPLSYVQNDQGLIVTPGAPVQPLPGIADKVLASACRVLRFVHDKAWINDDDLDVVAHGWIRRCNLGSGDYNNDLAISETPGDAWSCSFTGSHISVVAPKEAGAGSIEVQIDSEIRATANLSTISARQAQQVVCDVTGLTPGKHSITIVNRGPGPVAVDALIIH